MDYSHYTVEDFVADESFIQWVKNPIDGRDDYWSSWLSRHPEKEPVIREARQIVLMLHFKETQAPEGKFLEIWEKISDAGEPGILDVLDASTPEKTLRYFRTWHKVAAVFIVVALAFAGVMRFKGPHTITVQTAFGESRALFLPDSTKVTLNANSTLRYLSSFNKENREVWIEGEAFFAVVRKKDKNFRVHTDEVQVEVLGTRFNVNTRRGTSKVVLEEGKIKLDIPQIGVSAGLVMQPGDLVEVSSGTKRIERKRVDVVNYSSWRMNKLFFEGTSLEEIAQLLEDNYGFEVVFRDESLKEQRFTGSSSVDDPAELITKLNKVFGLNIRLQGNELVIQY